MAARRPVRKLRDDRGRDDRPDVPLFKDWSELCGWIAGRYEVDPSTARRVAACAVRTIDNEKTKREIQCG